MEFTVAQRAAIEARGCNLLVSAAAGSGKTAVLAARILSLIQAGTAVDALLVVTFTKAAAAEMRSRILSMLHEAAEQGDLRLMAEALKVERADISTLHGFCAKVCRDYFQAAGVDPGFRVGDGAEVAVLKNQAMEEGLIACFEEPTPAFAHAAACLTREELIAAVEQLFTFMMARPDPFDWLTEAIHAYDGAENLLASPWAELLLGKVCFLAETAIALYTQAQSFADKHDVYVLFTQAELAMAWDFLMAARAGFGPLEDMEVAFGRKPTRRKDADLDVERAYVALRKEAKDALQEAAALAKDVLGLSRQWEGLHSAGLMLQGVGDAVGAFHAAFARLKDEKNIVDFTDLEHFTLRALQVPAVAASLRGKYAQIFIDEYQDASQLQEAILSIIKGPDNLFMVGDVKQSIYRFRLAEPGLFLGKLNTFSPQAGAIDRRIDLNANFRSHSMILNGVNEVFDHVFCGGPMEIIYDAPSRLVAGKEDPWEGVPVELHLIDADSESEEEEGGEPPTAGELPPAARESIQWEAEVIAQRIIALRDAPEGGYALRDMAILMRAVRGRAAFVAEALREKGINAWTDLGEDALSRREVQAMVSLLRVVDNLRQDVPLLAALRGPAMGLTEETLTVIRAAHPEGTFAEAMLAYAKGDNPLAQALQAFLKKVRDWGADAQVLPLDTLLRRLYDETGYYAEVGALPGGAARQGNLRMLAERAGLYQRTRAGGLGGFLRHLEKAADHEGFTAAELGEADDVVRILSIHKSKGLQFPVVFVAGMGTRFRLRENAPLQLHGDLGAALPAIDPELRTKWTTLPREAIQEAHRQEALAEEARILYVAMTRAEKRLILTGTYKPAMAEKWQGPHHPAVAALSQLDFVAPSAYASRFFHIEVHPREAGIPAQVRAEALVQVAEAVQAHGAIHPKVDAALSWMPAKPPEGPLKTSVTSLLKEAAKTGEDEDIPLSLSTLPKRPHFMEEKGLSPAERGDAVHAFLLHVPLHAPDLEAAAQRMLEEGILSQDQADVLPLDKLARCLQDPLFQRMKAAETLRREWAFNLRIQNQGQRTLLQGVIDACFLEDGAWVVVDYKTDRERDPEITCQRHRQQLDWYAKALETITKKPVKARILFLIEHEASFTL